MARHWTTKDLEEWDERIRAKAEEFGLSCFGQEFEVCDQEHMLGYMAYHGMPAHYPHWSFGKSYEKLKTLYNYGVSGLPYEMVINADPALAYLMRDNSLCLQVLTVAHVYGHNDFFRNNYMFRDTRPELTLSLFKLHADRIRSYIEDPSIGLKLVEETLDAAHALSLQCRRHTVIRKLNPNEQRERAVQMSKPPFDPHESIHKPRERVEPNLSKVPLEPEEDLLLFIAEYNPYLGEWQRDLLRIVHEQAIYFMPQIETKIMNEGWASYWHHRIMTSLDLPEDLHFEFLVHHNQVVRPHNGQINPYYLGFKIWEDLERRHSNDKDPRAAMFEARESERDVSFLRRFLTRELMEEMHMFEYKQEQDKIVVSRVANDEEWQTVKQTLLRNIGMATVPVIRVMDADFNHNRVLLLQHEHDGRDLEMEYLEKTMGYIYQLWGRPVLLETHREGSAIRFSRSETGFEQRL
ncbi:MAG: SpoVR family protein [Gammaproteobacteria bacterium]|nr:SpoVR family protein [Gammaproteobacteria bacterium]